jgi:AraC-like DNA-binding protein
MPRTLESALPSTEPAACKNATEPRPKLERAPGVLYPGARGVETGRFAPSAELEPFVEHYWWVRWNVPEPFVSEVLTYPSVHVVFEAETARIVGIVRAKFSRRLEGSGRVCAIKFHPGMFRSFQRQPAFRLTDRTLPLGNELGGPAAELARRLAGLDSELERAKELERIVASVAPPLERDATLARDLVVRIRTDTEMGSVAALAKASGIIPRVLQRLFREYVGVSPKWVIRRFRLQEAADILARGNDNVAAVAARLGYFDQAHFVHDFKAAVGSTPLAYVKRARASSV